MPSTTKESSGSRSTGVRRPMKRMPGTSPSRSSAYSISAWSWAATASIPISVEEVARGAQADRLRHRRRAGLELSGGAA